MRCLAHQVGWFLTGREPVGRSQRLKTHVDDLSGIIFQALRDGRRARQRCVRDLQRAVAGRIHRAGAERRGDPGRAVQIDSIKPMLKAPVTKRLKLKYDELVSSFAFNFNLRQYTPEESMRRVEALLMVGRCRLNRSNPC
jgi:hypothetical protein